MKESYREDPASHSGPEPYAGGGDASGVASGKGDAGQPSSSEINHPECRSRSVMEKATSSAPANGEARTDAAESETLSMCRNSKRENRDIRSATAAPKGGQFPGPAVRPENAPGDTAGMDAGRKSDGSILPAKPSNNGAAEASAERVEERDLSQEERRPACLVPDTEPDPWQVPRAGRRARSCSRVRGNSKLEFTALLHHVDRFALHTAFLQLKKTAAVGLDGVTWHEYEQNVEDNIAALHDRIHRGAYRAKPSRRSWLPKPDGRKRPLGIASLEDKIVQQAVASVLQSIYEEDFIGFDFDDQI